jgi:hypothetical protein
MPQPRLSSPTPLIALALAFATSLPGQPARAETCSGETVTARGEQARFEWLAKTKARANWRRRVRAMPMLGPDYANWSRARDTTERCMSGPSGAVCIFTGRPCKL